MTDCYRCWAEVDLQALRENVVHIRQQAGAAKKLLTVVKADAYGHGLKQIAAVLMQSGTDVFGVANLAEARAIRAVGKGWPILMLGSSLPFETDSMVREGIMPTLSSLGEASLFSASASRQMRVVHAHLKVDTGMGRLGVAPDQALPLADAIQRLPGILLKGLYTHYSTAEDDAEFTARQRTDFAKLVKAFASAGYVFEWLHAPNSGGLLLEPDEVCNTVRPGLLVYGIVPPGQRTIRAPAASLVRPALTWKCRVSVVKEIPAATPISYGHTFISRQKMRIAIVTAGYGDGYPRAASNCAHVLVGGKRCPVLGRVTMDQMIVDVSTVAEVATNDEVVLIGQQGSEQITATVLAGWCATIPWEILTNITYRVPRVYRGSHAA